MTESRLCEIALTADGVNYFDLVGGISFLLEKKLAAAKKDQRTGEPVYTLLDEGKKLADEFFTHIPASIRDKTLKAGTDIMSTAERERSVRCDIVFDRKRNRYDLLVQFLNEINGDTILEIKLYAPDEEKAKEMRERFLSKPTFIITRTMNMFLKDDFFMYDK